MKINKVEAKIWNIEVHQIEKSKIFVPLENEDLMECVFNQNLC
jgi:hypothetical protein